MRSRAMMQELKVSQMWLQAGIKPRNIVSPYAINATTGKYL